MLSHCKKIFNRLFVFHVEMSKRVVNAKIACLDFSLQKTKLKMGVQVIITDPEKLDQIRQRLVCFHHHHQYENNPI